MGYNKLLFNKLYYIIFPSDCVEMAEYVFCCRPKVGIIFYCSLSPEHITFTSRYYKILNVCNYKCDLKTYQKLHKNEVI